MGHRLTPAEEAQVLRDLIREAHEAMQGLNQAIKEARALQPSLIAQFEQTHQREMQLLQNHMTAEQNHASADLNQAVSTARDEICRQLTMQEMILDHSGGVVKVLFSGRRFDDQVTPPTVQLAQGETTS